MRTKHLISLIVLIVGVSIVSYIMFSEPSDQRRGSRPPAALTIETIAVTKQSYQVILSSFGKVAAKVKGQLTAQVSGKIIAVSDKFSEGSFFNQGDILVSIDPRDYDIEVEAAQADVAQAQVAFDEEVALSAQAIKDRRDIGTLKKASAFALRKPQMAAAKAKLQAASAKLKQALLDVERTQIIAPYDGRILTKHVDIGQVISSNTNLADIFSTAIAQVKLPIKNSQLALLNLPGNHSNATTDDLSGVTIINNIGGESQHWSANLARTSGGIDNNTQQINIISEISQPFGALDKRSLNIGQFVNATIQGKLIHDAIVIPNSAIYQGSYVYLYQDGIIRRSDISISYQNEDDALISAGIEAGMHLVITPLGQVSSGTKVKLLGQKSKKPGNKGKRRLGKKPAQAQIEPHAKEAEQQS